MMNATLAAKKTELEKTVARVAGCDIEMTVRGLMSWTFGSEGDKTAEFDKLAKWFQSSKRNAKTRILFDAECDMTFLYLDL